MDLIKLPFFKLVKRRKLKLSAMQMLNDFVALPNSCLYPGDVYYFSPNRASLVSPLPPFRFITHQVDLDGGLITKRSAIRRRLFLSPVTSSEEINDEFDSEQETYLASRLRRSLSITSSPTQVLHEKSDQTIISDCNEQVESVSDDKNRSRISFQEIFRATPRATKTDSITSLAISHKSCLHKAVQVVESCSKAVQTDLTLTSSDLKQNKSVQKSFRKHRKKAAEGNKKCVKSAEAKRKTYAKESWQLRKLTLDFSKISISDIEAYEPDVSSSDSDSALSCFDGVALRQLFKSKASGSDTSVKSTDDE